MDIVEGRNKTKKIYNKRLYTDAYTHYTWTNREGKRNVLYHAWYKLANAQWKIKI